jgi:enoyl-CoA hydratase/carnithine racemase
MFSVEKQGAVAILEYRNPPHGFLTLAAIAQLRRILRHLDARVILFRGTMVHTELDEISAMLKLASRVPRFLIPFVSFLARWFSPVHAPFGAIARSPKITIATIDGNCIGGGLELALCCDYRFATKESLLGCPEVRMGLLPGFGGSQRLANLIGPARARELLLSGDLISAGEAERMGMLRVMTVDEMMQRAHTLSHRPPLAVAAIKRALPLEVEVSRELREVLRIARTKDVTLGLSEYRRALAHTSEIDQLMSRMEQVEFSGEARGSLRPSRAS